MNVMGILSSLVYSYHAQEMWRTSPDQLPRAPHSQPRRKAKGRTVEAHGAARKEQGGLRAGASTWLPGTTPYPEREAECVSGETECLECATTARCVGE